MTGLLWTLVRKQFKFLTNINIGPQVEQNYTYTRIEDEAYKMLLILLLSMSPPQNGSN